MVTLPATDCPIVAKLSRVPVIAIASGLLSLLSLIRFDTGCFVSLFRNKTKVDRIQGADTAALEAKVRDCTGVRGTPRTELYRYCKTAKFGCGLSFDCE